AAQNAANAYASANNVTWMAQALAPALANANGKYLPGGTEFQSTIDDIRTRPIPQGANFLDKTNMIHAEGMYNTKKLFDPEIVEIIVGANYRVYDLNSEGTLFTLDGQGNEFDIREWGAYMQAGKNFANIFRLTASLRYDKNENFKGQFSPRVSGVLTVAE